MKPTLKAPGAKRLKLKYEESLWKFAFESNLRHCITGLLVVSSLPSKEKGLAAPPWGKNFIEAGHLPSMRWCSPEMVLSTSSVPPRREPSFVE
jgi:hypothetical protein